MDSPRRSRRVSGAEVLSNPIVLPQPVIDRSIIDSVAGFISDVGLNSAPPGDPKDAILWARFETADINDPALAEDIDIEGSVAQPLLLVLGYVNGVQVWAIPANGEAAEVLFWRQGSVKILRLLQTPKDVLDSPLGGIKDKFEKKRPLMALVDSPGGGPQFYSLNYISLKDGEQVKNIKFNNPILDVVANSRVIAVTFSERIAIFDARTLEDRNIVTTCYPSPGLSPNPVALGLRWLAYAERRLIPGRKSSGGCDNEGTASYTATVLHAAKSLGKGLRGLGETVASSLSSSTIPRSAPAMGSPGSGGFGDGFQAGVVTVFDVESGESPNPADHFVAHFVAHQEAIAALCFDPSGLLLVTADKRGHDFHLFRIHPHPGGPSMAAVHHLYILHRGDTTAKIQDITFACDSRWIAVSSLRGTTHVFPVTPYGGPVGLRTHGSPHVVNRLSRFHRSAGLAADGRSNSPVTLAEIPLSNPAVPYTNPRIPPFPHPTVIHPLAQIRQPMNLANSSSNGNASSHRIVCGRQRISSYSEDSPYSMRVCATFATGRAYLLDGPVRDSSHKIHRKAVDSLFIMACHGALLQYDLDPKHLSGIAKEKICDDTPIELDVEPRAQWFLQRQPSSIDIQPPLSDTNWLLRERTQPPLAEGEVDEKNSANEPWLSQVEIVTHAGPHRRLWMGPQFIFKTYNAASTGSSLSLMEADSVEVTCSTRSRSARSNPVNMPGLNSAGRPLVSVLIEAGSCSSYEQSPRMLTGIRDSHGGSTTSLTPSLDLQLKEDLADAMRESPGLPIRESGRPQTVIVSMSKSPNIPQAFDDDLPRHESNPSPQPAPTVRMMVNAVGKLINLPPIESQQSEEDCEEFMHENCDEALFRPVVTGCNIAVKDNSKLFEDVSEDVCLRGRTIAVCITDPTENAIPRTIDYACSIPVDKSPENIQRLIEQPEKSPPNVAKNKSKNESKKKIKQEKVVVNEELKKNQPKEKEDLQFECHMDFEKVTQSGKDLDSVYKNKSDSEVHKLSDAKPVKTDKEIVQESKSAVKTNRKSKPERKISAAKIEVEEKSTTEPMEQIDSDIVPHAKEVEDESLKRLDTEARNKLFLIERGLEVIVVDVDDSDDDEAIKPEQREEIIKKKQIPSAFYEVKTKKAKTGKKNGKTLKVTDYSENVQPKINESSQYIMNEELEEAIPILNLTEDNDSNAKATRMYDESNLVVATCDEPEVRTGISKLEFQLDSEKILEMHDSFNDFADYGDQQDSDYKSLEVEIEDPYLSLEPCEFDDIQEKVKSDDSGYKNNDFVQIEQECVEGDKSSDSDSEKIKDKYEKRREIIPMDTEEDTCVENSSKTGADMENKPLPDVPSDTKTNGKKKSRKKRR